MYKKISKLDYGQYSKIYLVEDEEGEQQVLKVCLKELGYTFGMYREADIVSRFRHPHIICLHATYQGVPFEGTGDAVSPLGEDHAGMGQDINHLVYELASGNFLNYIADGEGVTFDDIISCLCDIFLGIEHMHLSGYCHRDLRCDNILIFKHDERPDKRYAKVADFGFTKYMIANDSHTPRINVDTHRAPECIRCSKSYGFGVDIWSLGCMLYTAFRYEAPFKCGGLQPNATIDVILEGLPGECGGLGSFEVFFPEEKWITNYKEVVELLRGLLQFEAGKRLTASQALDLPVFDRHRKRIEMTRQMYPYVTLPDKPLEVFECIERKWGVGFFNEVFTNRYTTPVSKWYSNSIFFFAFSIFEQVLVYYRNHEKPVRAMETLKSGRYFTKRQLSIIYITCLYFVIKYKAGTNSVTISYDMVYPEFSITTEEKKFAGNFEIKLFTMILDHEIFRKTIYDCLLEEYPDPATQDLVSLTRFAIYGHYSGKTLGKAFAYWKRNADYYLE